MWEFVHEESIHAPADVVFQLMSDLPRYKDWNPFLVEASGDIRMGGVVNGKSNLGWTVTPYRHRIFDYALNQSLCWRDFGFVAAFVCGERSRFVESANGLTQFKCHLKLSGPFSGLINLLFGNGLRQGVIAEARALKAQAEGESDR